MECSRIYGGDNDERAWCIARGWSGGYVLAGDAEPGDRVHDGWVVKTNEQGIEEWNRTYGGAGWDKICSVIQTRGGGYAFAGTTTSYCADGHDFWLVKTDEKGEVEWQRTYGGPDSEGAYSVIQTLDGGYALAGHKHPEDGIYTCWLVKTDPQGREEWNRTYKTQHDLFSYRVVQTEDGGYAVAGYMEYNEVNSRDMWLLRTNREGEEKWRKIYGGPNSQIALSVIQTLDGGFALVGSSRTSSEDDFQCLLIKTGADGEQEWNKTYPKHGTAYSLVQNEDKGYALIGPIYHSKPGDKKCWIIKTGPQGKKKWSKLLGGKGEETVISMVKAEDGYAIAGWMDPNNSDNNDFWLIKTRETGPYTPWIIAIGLASTGGTGLLLSKRYSSE